MNIDFLNSLLLEFFDKPDIKRKLKVIKEFKKWGGVERWWQIEFALFLENKKLNGGIKEYIREEKANIRQNCTGRNIRCHFDFRIKSPKCRKYMCLEIKADKSITRCVNQLDIDWNKYLKTTKADKTKDKNIHLSGIFCLKRHHKTLTITEVEKYINSIYKIPSVRVNVIGNSGLGFFLY